MQLRPELASASSSKSKKQEAKDKDSRAKEDKAPKGMKPVAKKVPRNLDTTGWQIDPETGSCNADVLIIGDSVTEGASAAIKKVLPQAVVDGAVSRQIQSGPEMLANYHNQGIHPRVLVYALGTNAALRGDLLAQNLIDSAEGEPMYIVTIRNPYPLQDMNNEVFNRLSKDNPNVGIIDWWADTEGHPEYLVDDGTHPTDAGNEVLANLYKQALCGR